MPPARSAAPVQSPLRGPAAQAYPGLPGGHALAAAFPQMVPLGGLGQEIPIVHHSMQVQQALQQRYALQGVQCPSTCADLQQNLALLPSRPTSPHGLSWALAWSSAALVVYWVWSGMLGLLELASASLPFTVAFFPEGPQQGCSHR